SRLVALTALVFAVPASQSQAMKIRMASLPERVAQANAVVVGKVTTIEEKNARISTVPGAAEKTEFQVAVIEIKEAVRGAKGLTHVRVAFPVPQSAGPARPGILRRGPAVTLTKGQEGCFFLQQHPEEAFFLLEPVAQPLDAKSDTFKREVAEA